MIAEKQLLLDAFYASSGDSISGDSMNKPLVVGLAVTGSVVFVVLCATLVVYVVRHRRLQQSFTSFANSHYDNRRGLTTFGSNDLGQLHQS